MPEISSAAPGHFVWLELATTDPNAARDFYSRLFAWTVLENDMGAMGKYYVFQKKGRDAAAMYGMDDEQKSRGIPPNWLAYIGVDDAGATVTKAQTLGGTVLQGPFDVSDLGRMAVLRDPQGAVVALWQAGTKAGLGIRDEDNTLCWNELATNDPEASRNFYTNLTGWEGKVSPQYTEWHIDGKAIGGVRTIHEGEPTPPNWIPYFMVDDCDRIAAKARAGGADVHVAPMDLAGVGRFAVLADPQGAVFALFKAE